MTTESKKLEMAMEALDGLACWDRLLASTEEPASARAARDVLKQIRGGDGRPVSQGLSKFRITLPVRVLSRQPDGSFPIVASVQRELDINVEAASGPDAVAKVGAVISALLDVFVKPTMSWVPYECPEHGKQFAACCEGARRKEHR